MEQGEFWHLGQLTDERLRLNLKELLASGYRTEARIIAHIAEVEERKLHLRDGSESLFDYCISRLGLSNSEAFHRITAARIAQRFPAVFTLVEQRAIHLTAICLLRDYLTPENHRELLAEATHKTKWQIQELLARRFPRPDVESRIRKLPAAGTTQRASATAAESRLLPRPNQLLMSPAVPAFGQESAAKPPVMLPIPTAPMIPAQVIIEPTSEARYRIQLNASAALRDKLELLRALTSHANPTGDLAVVIERAVDLALEEVQRKRFAKTEKPRQPAHESRKPTSRRLEKGMRSMRGRRHIPNATQREVATRDELRCSFVGTGGHRCTGRAFLQIHHEQPWARGGSDERGNLRLLCGQHNRLLAERDFGAGHVATKMAERRRNAARE